MSLSVKEADYKLQPDGRFIIKNYNRKKPFSNFLPGIAGLYGIPMWAFYVNRGQGIASFGTRNKDNAILEFFPANKAYKEVTSIGFRTFLRIATASKKTLFYEPFSHDAEKRFGTTPSMEIASHEFCLTEINRAAGLQMDVRYFTLPEEPLAALVREVKITNIGNGALDLEMADGLPMFNPYGMNEFFIKNMSRTIEAWMIVENLERNAPFYRLKVDATDRPEVVFIEEGNFYMGLMQKGRSAEILNAIIDPSVLFGQVLDFSTPDAFWAPDGFKFPKSQVNANKTPCAFTHAKWKLGPGKTTTFYSLAGHAKSLKALNDFTSRARQTGFFDQKIVENHRLIETIKHKAFAVTASDAFDQYCGQTYLDNTLRGGLPVYLGKKDSGVLFHVYSRKHGDLERDYNRFLVDPTYFSQGDGNYRDVNQNRRNDVWFDPQVRDTNIKTFLNLIQLDGFNPLVIKGTSFHFRRTPESLKILRRHLSASLLPEAESLLAKAFNLGEFYGWLKQKGSFSASKFNHFLSELAPFIYREEKAEHGEGFWVDHWTYNLDLIESYLAIYPENTVDLLLEDADYIFYDNDHLVRPRQDKYTLLKDRKVTRQFQSVTRDKEKGLLIRSRTKQPHAVRTKKGRGDIYKTTLFVKLLTLFANKLASLDARGVGVEMEADKPSWYDALNGLPGLFGSSLPETFELKRLALFMIHFLEDWDVELTQTQDFPVEIHAFIIKLNGLLDTYLASKKNPAADFAFWDAAVKAKEAYRAETFYGVSGQEKKLTLAQIKSFLEHAREKVDIGLEKAFDTQHKIYPTYFENDLVRYQVQKTPSGDRIKPLEFKSKPLPLFLEAPVHALKVEKDPARRKELLKSVRSNGLYDRKLGMYKVNAPLEKASLEVGRATVFGQGWLENETIWLHMEYKFLLELLRNGLTEDFFDDFKKVLIPFQPAERYGRSILENSSFIVSSAFLDPELHGTGFVARLSGSTAEFLSMWLMMAVGKKPFVLGLDKKLSLRFDPSLPADLFAKEDRVRTLINKQGEDQKIKLAKGSLAFLFLGKTMVHYHNSKRLNTFGRDRVYVKKVTLHTPKGEKIEFRGDSVPSPYAARVRDEFIPRIDIELG